MRHLEKNLIASRERYKTKKEKEEKLKFESLEDPRMTERHCETPRRLAKNQEKYNQSSAVKRGYECIERTVNQQ